MSLGVPTFSKDAAASLGVVLSESFLNVSQKLVLSASVGPVSLAVDEESEEPQAAVPPRTTSSAAAAATFVVNIRQSPSSVVSPHSALRPPTTSHRGSSRTRRPRRQRRPEQAGQQL